MFRGQFEHAIDAKGRTSLPARYRDVLAAANDVRLVLTPSLSDACLDVYPLRAFEDLETQVAGLSPFDPQVTMFRRLYIAPAVECDLDRQGRVLVPPSLREHAKLHKDVLWSGMGKKAELWSRELWSSAVELPIDGRLQLQAAIAGMLR